MRSAFNKNEPSLVVRFENQKRLAQYINQRPFGEGIGLSGVAAKRFDPDRITTNIPNDSWYVKVWVETGIVGLLVYLTIQFSILGRGIWLVLHRLKNKELKSYLTALLCGMFGMMVSSYGNAIWGQYPTCILMALTQAFIVLAPVYDKELASLNKTNHDTGNTD
jgi:O-antigen ligase